MLHISKEIYKAVDDVFRRLGGLRRWTTNIVKDKYSELAKQAMNSLIAYLIACKCENDGQTINWETFPKIAMYRAFEKAYVLFDISKETIETICEMGEIPYEQIKATTISIIRDKAGNELAEELANAMQSEEANIYRAATKVATYVELVENKANFNGSYTKVAENVIFDIKEFSYVPGVKEFSDTDGDIFRMLEQISRLRNQMRWTAYSRAVDCSVLGHLFDTGMFAYLMSREINPENEGLATKMFFMGIFHDIPEAWTKDIPSPIKDRIPGFREASELYENSVTKKFMYNIMPDYLAKKVKSVMMEEGENQEVKPFMKGADYLSASSECFRQVIAGSRDWNLQNKIQTVQGKPAVAWISPEAEAFYQKEIVGQVERIKEQLIFY